jgi:hypothetical protein
MAGPIVSAELGGNSVMTLYPTATAGTNDKTRVGWQKVPSGTGRTLTRGG